MTRLQLASVLAGLVQAGATIASSTPAHAIQAPPAQLQIVHLPEPTGPHGVGTRLVHWSDSERPEIGPVRQGAVRELMVVLFYPADVPMGATPAPYEPRAHLYHELGIFDDEDLAVVAATRRHAVADAPAAAGRARHPVAVLSTGNGEMAFMYTALAEELASHGYVIAVLSHPGVAHVVYPDGRVLRRYARLYNPKPEGWDSLLGQDPSLALTRAVYDTHYAEASRYLSADVSFVIDQLAALDTTVGDAVLAGRLDLDRVATIGHSYGGTVAVEACARDPRVRACVNMDGTAFGAIREEGLQKPYLLFRPPFVNDPWPRGLAQTQLFGSMKADAYEVNVVGAEHRSFMDSRFLFPENRRSPTGPRRVLHITSTYIRAFLGKYLFGVDSELMNRPSRSFPDVFLRILRFHYPAGVYGETDAAARGGNRASVVGKP